MASLYRQRSPISMRPADSDPEAMESALSSFGKWHYNRCHLAFTSAMEPEIIKALGGRRAFGAGRIDLLAEVERGLPIKAYVALVKTLALTPAEEDRLLQVSLRTRVRWKQRNRLDPAASDRLVRVARILALATDVLENRAHAIAWLREPSNVLRGRTPLQAISSDLGAEKVTNLLNQMEYGVYS